MFASNSRYYKLGTYTVSLANGQAAIATRLPVPPRQFGVSGYYTVQQNDRLDLIGGKIVQQSVGEDHVARPRQDADDHRVGHAFARVPKEDVGTAET